jgi:transposase
MAQRAGVAREIGEFLLQKAYQLMHWWHQYQKGKLLREQLIEAVNLLREVIKQDIEESSAIEIGPNAKTPFAKIVRTCLTILDVESALWSFVYEEGIAPINNATEQALRPAVVWRGLSFGSSSESGSQVFARMLSVNRTLKVQGRSVLGFLTESCIAARQGKEPPSLNSNDSDPSNVQNPHFLVIHLMSTIKNVNHELLKSQFNKLKFLCH